MPNGPRSAMSSGSLHHMPRQNWDTVSLRFCMRGSKAHSQLSSQRLCISYGNIPAGGSQGSGRRGFPFLVYRNTPHELACVAQVVPSRNVSRHPLSRAGHVSPTQPTGERQEMPVSTAGSSPTPDEAGAWQFWAHQDAAPQVGILS